jgi:hypothetical protein
MSNLRTIVDGLCSLQMNASSVVQEVQFKPQDDFILRRKINRSGPTTHEVLVGKILAMNDNDTADVSIQKAGGVTHRATVNVKDLQPVTESFKRSSIQFNPGYRPRV